MASSVMLASLFAPPALNASPSAAAANLNAATGSIICRKLTGAITFTPPMRQGTDGLITTVISFHASACTTKNSNVTHVSSGNFIDTTRSRIDGCQNVGGNSVLKGTETWLPSSIAPSTVVLEGLARRANGGTSGLMYASTPGRQQVIVAPAAGHAVSVTGSFPGKASYVAQENLQGSIVAYTNLTTGQPHAECKSPAGLAVMKIVSGVETLP